MSWWGKGLGVAVGYVAGGPVGALLGGALGYSADKGVGGRRWRLFKGRRSVPGELVEGLFKLLGAVAKADGRVSRGEVAWTDALIKRMGLTRAQRGRVVRLFNAGRQPGFQVAGCLARLRPLVVRDARLGEAVLQTLIDLAGCDGAMHPAQGRLIQRCGMSLGVAPGWLAYRLASMHAPAGNAPVADPYAVLGVGAGVSDREVKLAYRRLMQRHHPDRLGPRADAASRAEAARRSAEVRRAWEQLRLARGMR